MWRQYAKDGNKEKFARAMISVFSVVLKPLFRVWFNQDEDILELFFDTMHKMLVAKPKPLNFDIAGAENIISTSYHQLNKIY